MAKDSQSIRKKKRLDDETAQVNQSWDDTPAGQAYWKDIRGRNTDMEKQGLVNQGQIGRQEAENTGQLARQGLGVRQIDAPKTDIDSAIGKMIEANAFTDKDGKFDQNLFMETRRKLIEQSTPAAPVIAPTPEDKAAAVYGGMNNRDFKKSVNDPNSQLPTGGFGYIEGAGPKSKVRFTRVLGDSVSFGNNIRQQPKATEPVKTEMPPPTKNIRGLPPEVAQAQRGYEAKYSLWDRAVNAIGNQGSAETGIAPDQLFPEQPTVLYNRNRNNELFKRKKKQEEEDVDAYLAWSKKNRF